ncbi:hypothetical protein GH714_031863 [Hevea brasiliensis]|uniref:Uncharacterized protein n=1 Tax=Hevea brasiliensis TaxID=3981 RepID=A0A6A6NDH0_HEVBR|nr:hypothetical protein GH714_031788 [Hevea brasiliensis]KAF2322891.1 hypothetical protein GH714_031863 [Hevea brasiliensis]
MAAIDGSSREASVIAASVLGKVRSEYEEATQTQPHLRLATAYQKSENLYTTGLYPREPSLVAVEPTDTVCHPKPRLVKRPADMKEILNLVEN